MAKIADVIKYEGDNSTFVWKHPCEDFNTMSQLIVHESQEAIFFMNGQALDLLGPGRHTLETQNIPLLSGVLKMFTGGQSAFHCEVYFINKTVQMSQKWGTPDRVRFIEPTYKIPVDLGANGTLNLAVSDSRKLLIKLVGTMKGISWNTRANEIADPKNQNQFFHDDKGFTQSLQESFRPLISNAVKTHLATSIKSQGIDLFEIDEHLEELSEALRKKILPGFEEYGLTIPQLYISSVSLPQNDKNFETLRQLYATTISERKAEAEAAIVRANRKVVIENELTDTEMARHAAERDLIKAKAEAEGRRELGFSKTDEARFELEKQRAIALGQMGANSSGGGAAGDMMGFGMAMAMMPQMTEMARNASSSMASGQAPVTNAPTDAPAPTAAVCAKCGNPLPENAKFCLECGEKVAPAVPAGMIVCPECGKTVAKGKFCFECGHKFITNCPKCGAELVSGAKFCLECGEKL